MSEASPKPDPREDRTKPGVRCVYLLVELLAVVVVAGAVLWLAWNYRQLVR